MVDVSVHLIADTKLQTSGSCNLRLDEQTSVVLVTVCDFTFRLWSVHWCSAVGYQIQTMYKHLNGLSCLKGGTQ